LALENKRILYFVPEWPATTSGILHSTVLAEAAFVQQYIGECYFVGTDNSEQKAEGAEAGILKNYGIRSKIVNCYSNQYGIVSIHKTLSQCLKRSWSAIMEFAPTHIWVDTYLTVMQARKMARTSRSLVVFDMPAIYAEEIALRHGYGLRYYITNILEKRAVRSSDRISGVSEKLKKRVGLWADREDMVVIPCCYDEKKFVFSNQSRAIIRKECGFGDSDVVVCYCGGLSKWQRVDDIIRLCIRLSENKGDCKFLFMTQEKEKMQFLVANAGLPELKYRIKNCLPHEVPANLSAADCGIIMRDDVTVNNVASPIKIGEYLACGLPVILTKGIGDYSEMIQSSGCGLVLDEGKDIAVQVIDYLANADFGQLREKTQVLAKQMVSWAAQLEKLKYLYRL
jgi:glycosyltransferase involved in cell wall biosynthesis